MNDRSDDALVSDILGGDHECFAIIVERYQLVVYNLMYRYARSSEDAADMTQEVFCRIYAMLGRYRKQKSFFAWLYTLALNYARDWDRKTKSEKRTLHRFGSNPPETRQRSPASIVEMRQEHRQLAAAMGLLAGDRQEMVLLRYRHERSIREIAEIFQLSESAVKMRLKRALKDLAEHLKQ